MSYTGLCISVFKMFALTWIVMSPEGLQLLANTLTWIVTVGVVPKIMQKIHFKFFVILKKEESISALLSTVLTGYPLCMTMI